MSERSESSAVAYLREQLAGMAGSEGYVSLPLSVAQGLLAEVARWKKRFEDNELDADYVAAMGEQLTAEVNAHEVTKREVARLQNALLVESVKTPEIRELDIANAAVAVVCQDLRAILEPLLDDPWDVADIQWGELTQIGCQFCDAARTIAGGADPRPVQASFPHAADCPTRDKERLLGRQKEPSLADLGDRTIGEL